MQSSFRTLVRPSARHLILASLAVTGLALTACDTGGNGRPGASKSATEKKSSAKTAPKWQTSMAENAESTAMTVQGFAMYESGEEQAVEPGLPALGSVAGQGGVAARLPEAPSPATPPVMLGVRMRAIDPVLATHLGVDPRGASVLEDVAEELNGYAGGLRDHDVIVAVDGKTPADPGSVRRELRHKKAGDSVDFTVIRPSGKGQSGRVDVKVTLEAFDHGKFMSATPARVGG